MRNSQQLAIMVTRNLPAFIHFDLFQAGSTLKIISMKVNTTNHDGK